MRALVSVYDKTNIISICESFIKKGVEIISTGGTAKILAANNIPFISIEKVTKRNEILGGRMKTISFEVASSILFRRDVDSDIKEMNENGFIPIDFVVCNLYPFDEGVKTNAPLNELIELIDIGGPNMLRAAAKNFQYVTVLSDPTDYNLVIKELENNSSTSLKTREILALNTFKRILSYDQMISFELEKRLNQENHFLNYYTTEESLRYGENPHQKAKIFPLKNTYATNTLKDAKVLQGKELSYNNYLDLDAAFKCTSELKEVFPNKCSVTIIKHGTPCGVSTGTNLFQTLEKAWNIDPVSSFGSVIAFSDTLDQKCVEFLSEYFVEVVFAPDITSEAKVLLSKKKNLRVLVGDLKKSLDKEWTMRSIHGGLLVQEEDQKLSSELVFTNQTKRNFEINKEILLFGQTIIKYKKSNTLALVNLDSEGDLQIIASGVGQPNRLECLSKLIAPKIKDKNISDAVLFSDAFFPFRDSIDEAHKLHIKNIVQPGGSIKDKEVIEACNEYGMTMYFSGTRNFRH